MTSPPGAISTTKRSPAASKRISCGLLNSAARADPPSPAPPVRPQPAIVEIVPSAPTRRTHSLYSKEPAVRNVPENRTVRQVEDSPIVLAEVDGFVGAADDAEGVVDERGVGGAAVTTGAGDPKGPGDCPAGNHRIGPLSALPCTHRNAIARMFTMDNA